MFSRLTSPSAAAGALSLGVLAALSLTGCAADANKAASTATAGGSVAAPALVKSGTLLVCTHSGFKPFEYPEGGKIVGFDIDLAELVAKKVGATVEVVDMPFAQITSGAAFTAKQCDLGAAGMTITDTRKAALGVSDPYFNATQALLVKKGSAVKDLAGLKGQKLGVQTDTTGKMYGEEHAEHNGYTVTVFEDAPATGNAVKTGDVAASLNDSPVMDTFVKDNPDTMVASYIDTGEKYGMAVGKDNAGLLAAVNEVLKTAQSDGTYATIYEKWFGKKPSAS